MNLRIKKSLAATTLGVGKKRVILNVNRLPEIQEAITKQDIRDLFASGAISIKEISGRRKNVRKASRRRVGSVRKKIFTGKQEYVRRTRKLRQYLGELRKHNSLSSERYTQIRKEIRSGIFKTKAHMKEHIASNSQK